MRRSIKCTLVVLLGIALAGGLLVTTIIGFLWWGLTQDAIDQSSGPVTREQALKHCSIPLPPGAHHVEYASLASGLQEGDFWVRFEAPASECLQTAQAIFAKWTVDFRRPAPEFRPVSHPPREESTHLQTDWFDIDRISEGMAAGTGYGWEPRVWIDEGRGVLYYHVAD